MPYYIYRITEQPIRLLKLVEQHDSYAPASAAAKSLRVQMPSDANYRIKVIFADNELNAEDLLHQVREAAPGPDDE